MISIGPFVIKTEADIECAIRAIGHITNTRWPRDQFGIPKCVIIVRNAFMSETFVRMLQNDSRRSRVCWVQRIMIASAPSNESPSPQGNSIVNPDRIPAGPNRLLANKFARLTSHIVETIREDISIRAIVLIAIAGNPETDL